MYMEAVQKYVINMTKEEAVELRDVLGNLPSGVVRGTRAEDLYWELVAITGPQKDGEGF